MCICRALVQHRAEVEHITEALARHLWSLEPGALAAAVSAWRPGAEALEAEALEAEALEAEASVPESLEAEALVEEAPLQEPLVVPSRLRTRAAQMYCSCHKARFREDALAMKGTAKYEETPLWRLVQKRGTQVFNSLPLDVQRMWFALAAKPSMQRDHLVADPLDALPVAALAGPSAIPRTPKKVQKKELELLGSSFLDATRSFECSTSLESPFKTDLAAVKQFTSHVLRHAYPERHRGFVGKRLKLTLGDWTWNRCADVWHSRGKAGRPFGTKAMRDEDLRNRLRDHLKDSLDYVI